MGYHQITCRMVYRNLSLSYTNVYMSWHKFCRHFQFSSVFPQYNYTILNFKCQFINIMQQFFLILFSSYWIFLFKFSNSLCLSKICLSGITFHHFPCFTCGVWTLVLVVEQFSLDIDWSVETVTKTDDRTKMDHDRWLNSFKIKLHLIHPQNSLISVSTKFTTILQ